MQAQNVMLSAAASRGGSEASLGRGAPPPNPRGQNCRSPAGDASRPRRATALNTIRREAMIGELARNPKLSESAMPPQSNSDPDSPLAQFDALTN